MSYSLSSRAERDLDEMVEVSAEMFGLAQAGRYAGGLKRALEFLGRNPRAARLRTELTPPVRAYRYKAHMVVYDVAGDGRAMILRIRHGREN